MKLKIYVLVLFVLINSGSYAAKNLIELEVHVLLNGLEPISGAYINIVNQIPQMYKMPKAVSYGVRVTNSQGVAKFQLENIDKKGLLSITLIRDRCDWHSDFHDLNLQKSNEKKYKITLSPKADVCN